MNEFMTVNLVEIKLLRIGMAIGVDKGIIHYSCSIFKISS
jgi:hypothetical protein